MTTWSPEILAKAAYPNWDEKNIAEGDITKAADRVVKYDMLAQSDVPKPSDLIANLG